MRLVPLGEIVPQVELVGVVLRLQLPNGIDHVPFWLENQSLETIAVGADLARVVAGPVILVGVHDETRNSEMQFFERRITFAC